MTEYELHQERFEGQFDEQMQKTAEVLGTVDIPEEAIGVNTVATHSNPPIIIVSWLEP
jgi:hypothetical protein